MAKTLTDQMLAYSAYHRDPRNKFTHFFGVPLAVFALFLPLAWFRFTPVPVPFLSAASVFWLLTMLYYLTLDWRIAVLQAPFSLALLYLADQAAQLPFAASAAIFGATFVGGWTIQLIGHAFEGRRPALVDNLSQIFNAPLFLTIEALFLLGRRRDLHAHLEQQLGARRTA